MSAIFIFKNDSPTEAKATLLGLNASQRGSPHILRKSNYLVRLSYIIETRRRVIFLLIFLVL